MAVNGNSEFKHKISDFAKEINDMYVEDCLKAPMFTKISNADIKEIQDEVESIHNVKSPQEGEPD